MTGQVLDVPRGQGLRNHRSTSVYWAVVVLAACFVTPHDSIISLFIVLAALTSPVWWPAASRSRRYRRLVGWAAVWFGAQTVSDMAHGSGLRAALLGGWQPIVAVVSIGFIFYCYGQAKSTFVVVFLAMLTQLVFFHLAAFPGVSVDPWKYIYGIPATLVGAAALDRFLPGRRILIATIFLAASLANFVVDFRSLSGALFVGAVIMVARGSSAQGRARALALGVLAAVLAVPLLLYAIDHGYASADYMRQHPTAMVPTDPVQYVLEGRPELMVSTAMIEAHPWLGLGSHRELSSSDVQRILVTANNERIGLSVDERARLFGHGANAHSLLPNAWISAGILAVPFWLYLLYLMAGAIAVGERANALVAVGTPMLFWDAFFSPWSGHYEMVLGVLVGMALHLHEQPREVTAE